MIKKNINYFKLKSFAYLDYNLYSVQVWYTSVNMSNCNR